MNTLAHLGLTFKQVLKKQESEQLTGTALEIYSHLPSCFPARKQIIQNERRKTDLILI